MAAERDKDLMLFDVTIPEASQSSLEAAIKAACFALGQGKQIDSVSEYAWYVLQVPNGMMVHENIAWEWWTLDGKKSARVFVPETEGMMRKYLKERNSATT
jgi:hypothetical protein